MKWNRMAALATMICGLAIPATLAQDKGDKDGGKAKTLEAGATAPEFSLTGTDGKTYKLSDFKDKTVVLEWINKDCPFCQKQCDQMRETATTLAKKNVVWLAIDSTHSRKSADNVGYIKENKLPYVILDDSKGEVGHAYGAARTPTLFVIHKGKIAYSGALIPQTDEQRNYVMEAAEAVLAGKEVPLKSTKAYGCTVKYKEGA